jgi:hypothetical protein
MVAATAHSPVGVRTAARVAHAASPTRAALFAFTHVSPESEPKVGAQAQSGARAERTVPNDPAAVQRRCRMPLPEVNSRRGDENRENRIGGRVQAARQKTFFGLSP